MMSPTITKSCQEITASPTMKIKHKRVTIVIGVSNVSDCEFKEMF